LVSQESIAPRDVVKESGGRGEEFDGRLIGIQVLMELRGMVAQSPSSAGVVSDIIGDGDGDGNGNGNGDGNDKREARRSAPACGGRSCEKDLQAIVVIPPCFEPLVLDAEFDRFLLLEEVEGDVSEDCHVFGGVAAPDTTVVFSKRDVEGPVYLVVSRPRHRSRR